MTTGCWRISRNKRYSCFLQEPTVYLSRQHPLYFITMYFTMRILRENCLIENKLGFTGGGN